jgi:hypothetical protein
VPQLLRSFVSPPVLVPPGPATSEALPSSIVNGTFAVDEPLDP